MVPGMASSAHFGVCVNFFKKDRSRRKAAALIVAYCQIRQDGASTQLLLRRNLDEVQTIKAALPTIRYLFVKKAKLK